MNPVNNDPKSGGTKALRLPADAAAIVRQRLALRKELLTQTNLLHTRVAILGGSTTVEVKNMLELFLLANGIQPSFYESGYNRYSEEVLFANPDLWNFKPDIVFVHTTWRNVGEFPDVMESETEVLNRVQRETARFESIWEKIDKELGAVIIQNNFDLPGLRPLGNLEASESFGRVGFLQRLNAKFADYARSHSRFFVNDIHYISAQVGLVEWFAQTYWYNFQIGRAHV